LKLPALLAALLLFSAGAGAANDFARGYAAWEKGDTRAAVDGFAASVRRQPEILWQAQYHLGQAQLAAGSTEAGIATLEELADSAASLPYAFGSSADLAFRANLRLSEVLARQRDPYSAAGRLLSYSEDARHGPEALYRAGDVLLASGDTANALKVWKDLILMYPVSPFAHRAVLAILDMPSFFDNMVRADNYLALVMARSAFAAGDYSTDSLILEPLMHRAVDRRLREEILVQYARLLYKLSQYDEALKAWREAERFAEEPEAILRARRNALLSALQLGDTVVAFTGLKQLAGGSWDESLREGVVTAAAVRRVRGDTALAALLPELIDTPVLESFLLAWNAIDPASADVRRDPAYGLACARAERIADATDRSLALALIAERTAPGGVDLWRSLIDEGPPDYLLAHAARRIAAAPAAPRAADEAGALLDAALRASARQDASTAMRWLRLCRYGYPGTVAARRAEALMREMITEYAADTPPADERPRAAAAALLTEARAYGEADAVLAECDETWAQLRRARGAFDAGRAFQAVALVESVAQGAPWPLAVTDLPPALRRLGYPLAFRAEVAAAADTWRIDPALLLALAREESAFDPTFHDDFRFGVAALPQEVVVFASECPGAPRMTPLDLFQPRAALGLNAWYLRYLSGELDDTRPARLAGARHAGLAFLPPWREGESELEWIATVPFAATRRLLLKVLFAREIYQERWREPGR